MTRIVLVRHGHSRATADQVVGGPRGCKGLTDLGRQQCDALRDRWLATGELGPVSALYASTLPRAIETAELLRPALGLAPAHALVMDCDLCEIHPSDAVDGLAWDQVPDQPDARHHWEPLDDFGRRVEAAISRLAKAHRDETIVVATHGGVIFQSMAMLIGRTGAVRFDPDNTGVTEWETKLDDQREGTWRLLRYNDTAHLSPSGVT